MTGSAPDVIVVGAGIVGAACAEALARARLSVLVVEPSLPGGGATAAAMGHLVVMDDSPAQLALTRYSRDRWHRFASELTPDCEDRPTGTLWLAAEESEWPLVQEKLALCLRHGIAAEVLDGAQLAEAEPILRPGLRGALLVPDDRVLYPPNAARWLLRRAGQRGARLRRGRVTELGDRSVTVVGPAGTERIHCGAVVLATGVDSPALVPELPIMPRKGHLAITDRYAGLGRRQLVELGYLTSAHTMSAESVAFNLQPRATGQLLIGSSRELVGRDASINRPLLRRMLERATAFAPALGGTSVIRVWTGFRPATPDKLPLVGPWPAIPGLWVAAGHEGLGITTATGTADLIAAGIGGGAPPLDPTPFRPDRPMPAIDAAA